MVEELEREYAAVQREPYQPASQKEKHDVGAVTAGAVAAPGRGC